MPSVNFDAAALPPRPLLDHRGDERGRLVAAFCARGRRHDRPAERRQRAERTSPGCRRTGRPAGSTGTRSRRPGRATRPACPTPISAPLSGMRLPNRRMTKKPTVGMTGISQAFSRNHMASRSALHLGQLVERDRAPVAVDEQHHGQAHADLGGGHGDDVQGERLPAAASGPERWRAKARRLMLTEFRMSSIDISTSTAFLRASTPYTPMENRTAPEEEELVDQHGRSVFPGQHDGADHGREQHEGQGPERDQVRPEDRVADVLDGLDGRVLSGSSSSPKASIST